MADDLRVVSILPSTPAQGIAQPPQVTPGGGTTSQSPVLTAGLPTGTVLSGFIVNRDPSGNPILRTDKGDITFSTGFFLKIGSEVVLRIENRGGNTLAHLLSVNGQPPEIAETQSGFTEPPDVIVNSNLSAPPSSQPATPAATTAAPAQTPAPAQAVTVSGTVLPPLPSHPVENPLPAGSQVTFKILSVAPASDNTPRTAALAASAPAPALSTTAFAAYARASGVALPVQTQSTPTTPEQATPQAPVATAAPQTASPPISTGTVPISPTVVISNADNAIPASSAPVAIPAPAATAPDVATPAPPANTAVSIPATPVAAVTVPQTVTTETQPVSPTPPTVALGQTVTASVIGYEPGGEALVQTPVGIVRLQPGIINLPQGSTLTLEVNTVSPADAEPVAAMPLSAPATLPELAQSWPALQQIVSLLGERTGSLDAMTGVPPAVGLPMLIAAAHDPQAGVSAQNISAGLMLFIAALRGGDFSNWLGKSNVQWLEDKGYGDLVRKAGSEFTGIAQQYVQGTPQQWQALFFPLAAEGQWQQVRMFIKRDKRQSSGNRQQKAEEDTRFVVEIDLSQLGEMQMDGFVRRQEQSVEFDLYIRSLAPLQPELQQDIAAIYNQMGEITGYKGTLLFQAVKEFPVNPMEEVMAQALRGVIA